MPLSEHFPATHTSPRARQGHQLLSPAALYDNWLVAETQASLALAAWRAAPSHEKRHAHAVYSAMLIREAHAANVLELRLSRM